jgi:outer membrane protein TolC
MVEDQSVVLPSFGGILLPPMPVQSDMTLGTVQITQPLFDPANMLYNTKAAQKKAEAARIRSSRQAKETQGTAIGYFLQILELRSKRSALEIYRNNLKGRQNEITRLYDLGAVSESDVLKIKLGIDDADQGIREIALKEDYLARMLAVVLGTDQVRTPEDLPDELPNPTVRNDLSDVNHLEKIHAMDAELESLKSAQSGLKADYLPKVSAFAQHSYTNSDLFNRSSFDTGGVLLSWSLFDGGVNLAKAKAVKHEHESLEQMRGLEAGSIQAGFRDAVNTLQTKRREYDERRAAVAEAKNGENIEFKRLKNGKSTVNNLIDAEDTLKDRTEKASLSRVNWYEAWFHLELAAGEPLSAPGSAMP